MTPPIYDTFNIDVWKVKMSMYLKILGLHVYLAATKKSFLGNSKHIEANAQALEALKCTLSKEHLSIVSHCDSAFAVWNTLTFLKLQTTKYVEEKSSGGESEQACYIVQGMTPLKYIRKFN